MLLYLKSVMHGLINLIYPFQQQSNMQNLVFPLQEIVMQKFPNAYLSGDVQQETAAMNCWICAWTNRKHRKQKSGIFTHVILSICQYTVIWVFQNVLLHSRKEIRHLSDHILETTIKLTLHPEGELWELSTGGVFLIKFCSVISPSFMLQTKGVS